jgi:hypothetical protein
LEESRQITSSDLEECAIKHGANNFYEVSVKSDESKPILDRIVKLFVEQILRNNNDLYYTYNSQSLIKTPNQKFSITKEKISVSKKSRQYKKEESFCC